MDRPALKRLLADIEAGRVDAVVVYKVDRLSRSLLDFAKMLETFDRFQVSFVSVTQQINSATSMGRLMLNVLLSFAQFEREIIGERTRDKIAATRRKGKWSGGRPLLGYDVDPRSTRLVVNEDEALNGRIARQEEKARACEFYGEQDSGGARRNGQHLGIHPEDGRVPTRRDQPDWGIRVVTSSSSDYSHCCPYPGSGGQAVNAGGGDAV